MTRAEVLLPLEIIKEKGARALRLLEEKPLSFATEAEIRSLAQWLKDELHKEYHRMLPNEHRRQCHYSNAASTRLPLKRPGRKVASTI
jgi:hypothetical protein